MVLMWGDIHILDITVGAAATGQILHVPVVVLLVGDRDRLLLVALQGGGPQAEGLDVVAAQRHYFGHHQPSASPRGNKQNV